jgi:hypothetical protein
MGGGLMQLVAYGAQDIYLTGNPQITFFKVVYRRHTNFSMEAIEQTLTGNVAAGSSPIATISRNGDLVHRMYLQNVDTAGSDYTCDNPGHNMLDYVELEIGGQRIDKHFGHWMETWTQLYEQNDTGHEAAMATVGGAYAGGAVTSGTRFQRMSLAGGVASGTTAAASTTFVPLQFWFCRNPGLALPLIALQYHEVKVKVAFGATALTSGPSTTSSISLWADYIYLDTDERRRFAQQSHEYLIEQVQHQSYSSTTSAELNFNHPVKELVWTGTRLADGGDDGQGTPAALGATTTFQLKLNGHDRFAARNRNYFTRTQVWQHHSGFGGINNRDNIAVYSFALKPEEHQPSGTCNFSRIDNARLVLSTGAAIEVYAVNYNVLRVMSGMGGLAYSN